jgi:hypothetical protein
MAEVLKSLTTMIVPSPTVRALAVWAEGTKAIGVVAPAPFRPSTPFIPFIPVGPVNREQLDTAATTRIADRESATFMIPPVFMSGRRQLMK